MHKNKAFIAPLGLVSITILSGVFLMASNSSATDTTDAVDSVSIGVPISCSMEGTGMTSHNASIPNGTYTADKVLLPLKPSVMTMKVLLSLLQAILAMR